MQKTVEIRYTLDFQSRRGTMFSFCFGEILTVKKLLRAKTATVNGSKTQWEKRVANKAASYVVSKCLCVCNTARNRKRERKRVFHLPSQTGQTFTMT